MSRLNVTEYTSTFFLSNSLTSSSPFLFLVCYLIYTYIIIVVYCGSNVLQTPQKPFNGCIPAADKIYRKYSFIECTYTYLYIQIGRHLNLGQKVYDLLSHIDIVIRDFSKILYYNIFDMTPNKIRVV